MSWLQSITQMFQKGSATQKAHERALPCYQSIVAAARHTRFYEQMQIADTPQGRFEMILLHAWLVIDRLAAAEPEFTQDLFDLMFADFDTNLRELGVGDLGVGHRVKGWAAAFYGRAASYKSALVDETMLADALQRNIFAGQAPAPDMRLLAFYTKTTFESLAQQTPANLMAGKIKWPE